MELLSCIIYLTALALLAHPIGQALPDSIFNVDRFPYRGMRWERDGTVYNRLNIRRWKKYLPDASRALKDMPRKSLSTGSVEELEILVRETCRAELVHWCELLLGFVCCLLYPGIWGLAVSIMWGLLGNLPFIIVQRYNRPRLLRRMKMMKDNADKLSSGGAECAY